MSASRTDGVVKVRVTIKADVSKELINDFEKLGVEIQYASTGVIRALVSFD